MASLTFMLPLGVSIAASTRIGNLVGAGDLKTMRASMRISLVKLRLRDSFAFLKRREGLACVSCGR